MSGDVREQITQVIAQFWAATDNPAHASDAIIAAFPVLAASDALQEWIHSEPYEVTASRTGIGTVISPSTDPAVAWVQGYQTAVAHAEATLGGVS